MGDIREIHHTYRIDPRTQHTTVQRKPSGDQPKKDQKEHPEDEVVLTHHEEDGEPQVIHLEPNPGDLPSLDISA